MTIKNEIDDLTVLAREINLSLFDTIRRAIKAENDFDEAEELLYAVSAEIEDLKIVQLCLTGK